MDDRDVLSRGNVIATMEQRWEFNCTKLFENFRTGFGLCKATAHTRRIIANEYESTRIECILPQYILRNNHAALICGLHDIGGRYETGSIR